MNAAPDDLSLDAHLTVVRQTGSRKEKTLHAIGCEYIHIHVDGLQLTIKYTAGVHRELHDQFITAHNEKSPWWTTAFVRTIWEIEQRDVISFGIFADEFGDKCPWEWHKQAWTTLEDAMEAWMVEVIAESHK